MLPLPVHRGRLWLDRFDPSPAACWPSPSSGARRWPSSCRASSTGIMDGSSARPGRHCRRPVRRGGAQGGGPRPASTSPQGRVRRCRRRVIYAAMVARVRLRGNVDYYGAPSSRKAAGGSAVILHRWRGMIALLAPALHQPDRHGPGRALQSGAAHRGLVDPPRGRRAPSRSHALWNAGASAGMNLLRVYGLVMIPRWPCCSGSWRYR